MGRVESYVDYTAAEAFMEARVAAIAAGEANEMVWLLEHPPLYTAGVSGQGRRPSGCRPVSSASHGGEVDSSPITGRGSAWPM
jgi:lipoyl(octanoyl) transferase